MATSSSSSAFSSGLLAHNVLSRDIERTSDVIGEEPEQSRKTFGDLHLPEALLAGISTSGFVRPSPVQLKAIPLARLGLDLLVQAKSGTGKTLVFVVAALSGIDPVKVAGLQALVVAPTREIAVQAARVALDVGAGMPGLKVHTFIGGMSVQDDIMKLRRCNLATGTPGRIKQLIEEGHMKTDTIRLLALDEADKLMESSFADDITWIFNHLPPSKQVIATSATYPDELAKIIELYMRNPTHVRLAKEDQVLQGVSQYLLKVNDHPVPKSKLKIKTGALFHILNTVSFSQCLVFSNYALRAEALCELADQRGWPAVFIASSMDQRARLQAIQRLKQFTIRVLFSTDLTARGIDAQNVNLVINMDVPWDSETYLHRIGRAGRFGTLALAVTIASEGEEFDDLRRIVFKTGSKIRAMPGAKEMPEGFDLWQCDLAELELVEGLEEEWKKDVEEEGEGGGGGRRNGKVRRRGRKEKNVGDLGEEATRVDDENAVDITKAWVEVKKDASTPHGREGVARSKDKQRLHQDGKVRVDNDYACAKGVLQGSLKKISDKMAQSLIPEKVGPGLQEIEETVEQYMNGEWNAAEAPEDEDFPEQRIMTGEAAKACKIVLDQEEKEFQQLLNKTSKKISSMSLQDAVKFVKGGKEIDQQSDGDDGDAELQFLPSAQHVVTERGDEGGHGSRPSSNIKQHKDFSAPSSSSRGYGRPGEVPSSYSHPLPHPNPNRLVPKNARLLQGGSDMSWARQWYQEVQENKEFIRDMEFLEQMRKLKY